MPDCYIYELVRYHHFHGNRKSLYKEFGVACGWESGTATFRKPGRAGWRDVAAGAALNHGCICRILVSISVSSYTELSNFPFSSRVHAPHALPLHCERCFVPSLRSLQKNILRRNCLIRNISGLIMESLWKVGSFEYIQRGEEEGKGESLAVFLATYQD